VRADAKYTEPVMLPARDALALLAAQHVDQMHGAEPLAGAVDRGERLAGRLGRIPGLRRIDARVAVAACCARFAEIIEQSHAAAAGGFAQAEQGVELGGGNALVV